MAPHQAQRTLVKSRPELWAEVSDVEALCRHLGEFGEITITRLEPETTVAWEGTAARGTVELEASGWGTKVTLTAELVEVVEPPADGQPAAEHEPSGETSAVTEPVPAADADVAAGPARAEPAPEDAVAPAPPSPVVAEAEPEPAAAPTPAALRAAEREAARRTAAPAPKPAKQGFFSRLFGRRSSPAPATAPPAPPAEDAPPLAPPPVDAAPVAPVAGTPPERDAETPETPDATPAPPSPAPLRLVPRPDDAPGDDDGPAPDADPDPDAPLVAEHDAPKVDVPEVAPEPVRVLDGERAVAVLTAALDDLGAAHRRPFSHS